MTSPYLTAQDIAAELAISRSAAYRIVQEMTRLAISTADAPRRSIVGCVDSDAG